MELGSNIGSDTFSVFRIETPAGTSYIGEIQSFDYRSQEPLVEVHYPAALIEQVDMDQATNTPRGFRMMLNPPVPSMCPEIMYVPRAGCFFIPVDDRGCHRDLLKYYRMTKEGFIEKRSFLTLAKTKTVESALAAMGQPNGAPRTK